MTITTQVSTNPYVGPRPYGKGETLYGRDREFNELRDLLIAERIVLLHAPSGAGKTSLIQAALIPELENENFQVLPIIRVGVTLPQGPTNQANRYLLGTLLSLEGSLPQNQEGEKRAHELASMELAEYLDKRPARLAGTNPEAATAGKHRREVLIFDQFEEILTEDPTDLTEKKTFFDQLGEALGSDYRWALFALREEELGGLDPYKAFIPTRLGTTYRLGLLTPEQATLAVRRPAQEAGVNFTDEAAEKVINDLRRVRVRIQRARAVQERLGPYVEPLQLQVVCRHIWESRRQDATEITVDDVQSSSANTALIQFYEDGVRAAVRANGVSQARLREWCETYLITPAHTRGMVVQGPDNVGGMPNAVVEELVEWRLLRCHEEQSGARWYELTHDRLIGPIQESNRPLELRPTQKTLTDEELRKWLDGTAYYLSRYRRLRKGLNRPLDQFIQEVPSTDAERALDERNAKLLFGCGILDGTIDLANQTSWSLYALLEDLWLDDIKQLPAYFNWENKGGGWDPERAENNYYQACEYFRLGLADKPEIKRSEKVFGGVRAYLDDHYLRAGKLDPNKSLAKTMMEKKAYRIMAATGQTDPDKNWVSAEKYAKLFYDNIIPAVQENPEKVQMVLEALDLSEASKTRFLIINCFEAAVAICFLNPNLVKQQWEAGKPLKEKTL